MSNKSLPKWTEERTEALKAAVGTESPVSVTTVERVAQELDTTNRSVSAKLRKLGYEVESASTARTKTFTPEQEEKLRNFVESNPGAYTYSEIAAYVFDDDSMARKVQGKLLSMELTDKVRKTPPKETEKAYTEEQEELVLKMIKEGAYLEDIAEAVGKPINSVRGKALSLMRAHGTQMPKQRDHVAKDKVDPLAELANISELTVAEIASAIDKTERGVKTILTRRGLTAKDYDGAARHQKLAEKKAAEA